MIIASFSPLRPVEIVMTEDVYEDWLPLGQIPDVLYCEGLVDDYGGIKITLKGRDLSSPSIEVGFRSVIAYRNINETYRLRTLNGAAFPERSQTLFVVQQSSWISWLKKESGGILDDKELIHYAIFTPEDCIDVVSEFPPTVIWVGAKSEAPDCGSVTS